MSYAPKTKSKLNLKIIIPILVVVIGITFFGVFQLLNFEDDSKDFKVCGLSHKTTKEELEKDDKNIYTLSDYFFYGESLGLYRDQYNVEVTDDLSGKSVVLKDICSDKEYSFVMRNTIDTQLILNKLNDGYYQLYVVEDLVEKRVIFSTEVNENFLTVNRNSTRKNINLLASTSYFADKGIKEKQNYAYLVVSKGKIMDDEYDIVLDPGALDRDFSLYSVEKGSKGNSLVEYQETSKAAKLLKAALEEKGLKVLVTREDEEELNSYGEKGRLQKAYDAKAKYYIRLRFEESKLGYEGMDITYSSHSNGMFAKQLLYTLSKQSGVAISSVYNPNDPGRIASTLYEGKLDNRVVYDSDLWVREAGGKATQAGMFSASAEAGTASFAKNNVFGMNTININLGYLTSKKDVEYWNNNRDEYIQAIASGVAMYLNIEE